jgi:hypothetical protein
MALDQKGNIMAEVSSHVHPSAVEAAKRSLTLVQYVWIDSEGGTRSKSRVRYMIPLHMTPQSHYARRSTLAHDSHAQKQHS